MSEVESLISIIEKCPPRGTMIRDSVNGWSNLENVKDEDKEEEDEGSADDDDEAE
jgi:hypothetical protein